MERVHYHGITFVLFITGLLVMFSLYSTITIGASIAQDFSVPVTNTPLASMAFSFTFALGCLIYGILSDKFGRKQIMLYGLIAHTILRCYPFFYVLYDACGIQRRSRFSRSRLCADHHCLHFRLIS